MHELLNKYRRHINNLIHVDLNIFDVRLRKIAAEQDIYCSKCSSRCDYANTHLYGSYEAQRWGNKYVYYCPKGFIFIAIAILNESAIMDTSIIAGPIIMGESEDFPDEDKELPNMSTSNVHDLTEIMVMLFGNTANVINSAIQTEEFLNDIYKVIDEIHAAADNKYPVHLERELQNAIIAGDGALSKELLNKLLGHIFFNSNNDLETINTRVLELIVLLSRSAIDGGAEAEQILALSGNYIKEIEHFSSIEKLSVWLADIINRYVGYVFSFRDIKHKDIIFKVNAYIKENYAKKLTLDEIANHVYLSKSYLSKIFKEEMDCGLAAYINKIRVEKSRSLLLDNSISLVMVANLCGFEDQSYYTKVFKAIVGVSPGKFREKHGNINQN